MADTNVLIPTANVEGNITSCKIENQLLRIDRSSVLAFTEYKTYASYDVCSKKIIDQYTVPEATGFVFLAGLGIAVVLVLVITFVGAMFAPSPYDPIRF